MAPEQLAGQPATTKTDIYALGLVLFEMFTGRRAFDAKTLGELVALHSSGTNVTPSSVVPDLDPAVERIIERCLEKDPARRPASALAVAAALPGGNPLAEALAAGETPSPDLLVAAGETEALPVATGLAFVALFLAGLGVFVSLAPASTLVGLVPPGKPPAVLVDRVEAILETLGYTERETDHAFSYLASRDYLNWIARTNDSPHRWDVLRAGSPPGLLFWYRRSPADLVPVRSIGNVSLTDPPEVIPGMLTVIVDTTGRLQEFRAVPPQFDPAPSTAATPAWSSLFQAAGLDMSAFSPAAPAWTPRSFADTRSAWEGPLNSGSDLRIRIEAAAYRGRPVSFAIVGPWTPADRVDANRRNALQSILNGTWLAIWISGLIGAALLARHNLRVGRADRRSANRLASWLAVTFMLFWAFENHHVNDAPTEVNRLFLAVGNAVYQTGTLWVMYLAIEPYARRLWPDGLVGWTRLLSGRLKDSRVGREILLGCVIGAAQILIELAQALVPPLLGRPTPRLLFGGSNFMLSGSWHVAGELANSTFNPIQSALFICLLFVALRFALRRTWAAAVSTVLLLMIGSDGGAAVNNGFGLITVFYVLQFTLIVVALFRFGLLVTTIALMVDSIITNVPIPAHLSDWSAAPADWTIALLIGLACFAFYASRTGQPLFGALSRSFDATH
jgi:hypothetical protein